ncbi:phage terminase large subunit [Rhodospirillaceae bacterium SYSU D60014]|uniref:phage terminase large subunit n=1 Tax=Virgifigura deserti TaxID=2268457 RepID=UPI000E66DCE2
MSRHDRDVLNALLKARLASFVHRAFQMVAPGETYLPGWSIEALCWHLEQCYARNIKRLIITLPPRALKSICASVAFPAWALGRDPRLRVICASYGSDLAGRHGRDCRRVMASPWYRQAFPSTRLDPAKSAELNFLTTAGGFRLGTSVGGPLTGLGGNFIIVDDPIKASDAMSESQRRAVHEWFDGTLLSRLDNKSEDVIILVAQRLHVDDLVGYVLEKGSQWVHLNLPAIAPEAQRIRIGDGRVYDRAAGELLHPGRDTVEDIAEMRIALGEARFAAQYQQDPVPPGGSMIRASWLRTYTARPVRGRSDQVVQSWDTACKMGESNDCSVCTTWLVQGTAYYLLDVFRGRLEYPELRRQAIALAERDRPSAVLIEDRASGTQLIQDLRMAGPVRPIEIKPEGDKLTRMYNQTATLEAGCVLLPDRAPWLEAFRSELLQFPYGKHDDQVDSLSQFLTWIDRRPSLQIFV